MVLTYFSLSSCSIQQIVDIWNKGFEDYFVTMKFNEKKLLDHLAYTDISPELSFIGLLNGQTPVGIVLNGIREIEGKKVAWNGGTGIAKAYRGSGYGEQMIKKSLDIYREHHVDIATLEAFEQNAPAIRLYQKMGFQAVETLHFHTFSFASPPPACERSNKYRVSISNIHEAQKLSFWNPWIPWQNQVTHKSSANAAILWDRQGNPLSYAIFHKTYNEDGICVQCTLNHCEVSPSIKEDKQKIYAHLLSHVFPFFNLEQQIPSSFVCSTYNFIMDMELSKVLQNWGFKRKMGQVWMQQHFMN